MTTLQHPTIDYDPDTTFFLVTHVEPIRTFLFHSTIAERCKSIGKNLSNVFQSCAVDIGAQRSVVGTSQAKGHARDEDQFQENYHGDSLGIDLHLSLLNQYICLGT